MKQVLFLLFIVIHISVFSQKEQNLVVFGKITNEALLPIPNVNISIQNTNLGTVADQNGGFIIEIPSLEVNLIISHINYRPIIFDSKQLQSAKSINDTIIIIISLAQKVNELNEVIVSSSKKPVEVVSNQLIDYEFTTEGLVYLITKKEGAYLQLLKNNREFKLPFSNPLSFKKDLFNELHILTKDSVYQIFISDSLKIYPALKKDYFEKNILRYKILTKNSLIYLRKPYSTEPMLSQNVELVALNTNTKERKNILNIFDKENYKIIRQDSLKIIEKYYSVTPKWLNQIENKTWNKTINGLNVSNSELIMMIEWYLKITFKPIFVRLIDCKTKFCVFDYANNTIFHFSYRDKSIKTVPFQFSDIKHIQNKLLFDKLRNEVYILVKKNGFVSLNLLDIKNGKLISANKIEQRFPKKIKVNNGFAYYIIENTEFGEHDKLYKMPL